MSRATFKAEFDDWIEYSDGISFCYSVSTVPIEQNVPPVMFSYNTTT